MGDDARTRDCSAGGDEGDDDGDAEGEDDEVVAVAMVTRCLREGRGTASRDGVAVSDALHAEVGDVDMKDEVGRAWEKAGSRRCCIFG